MKWQFTVLNQAGRILHSSKRLGSPGWDTKQEAKIAARQLLVSSGLKQTVRVICTKVTRKDLKEVPTLDQDMVGFDDKLSKMIQQFKRSQRKKR